MRSQFVHSSHKEQSVTIPSLNDQNTILNAHELAVFVLKPYTKIHTSPMQFDISDMKRVGSPLDDTQEE